MLKRTRARRIVAVTMTVAALAVQVVDTAGTSATGPRATVVERKPAAVKTAAVTPVRLPLRFEAARPPIGGPTTFVARGAGYALSVSGRGATLLLGGNARTNAYALTMSIVGARGDAVANPQRPLAGVSHYLFGNDSKRWLTDVRGYGEIAYRDVYRGVDVVYYGNQQQLEYDFVVAPGVSPKSIALKFDGAVRLHLNQASDLVIATPNGDVVQRRPEIYQNDGGVRRAIRGGYVVRRNGTIGFTIDEYDRRLPLVIDPVLSYVTYLGGTGFERVGGVAIDAAGNVIVAGTTPSADFPVVPAVQGPPRGADVFVSKLSPAGDALIYSTYLGGWGYDSPSGVALDDAGNAYVTGYTESSNFPATTHIGPDYGGWSDAFVVKIDSTGALVYATRIGGGDQDYSNAIAVDGQGRAKIVGNTISADFPVVNPFQPQLGGDVAFHSTDGGQTWSAATAGLKVANVGTFAFDPAQSGTAYAITPADGVFRTRDGGASWSKVDLPPQPFGTMAAQGGAVFLAGAMGVYRTTDHGDTWINVAPSLSFVTSLVATTGSSAALYAAREYGGVLRSTDGGLTWTDSGLYESVGFLAAGGDTVYAATHFGVLKSTAGGPWGSSNYRYYQRITALAVDTKNPQIAYMGTDAGLWMTVSGGADWFLVPDVGTAYIATIAVAASNPATVFISSSSGTGVSHDSGQTWMPTGLRGDAWPTTIAVDPQDSSNVYAGTRLNWDAFLTTLSADGSALESSTFIGGRSSEVGRGVAVDTGGNTYVAGETYSTDFPTANPIQAAPKGLWDAFVMKLAPAGTLVYSTYVGGSGTEFGGRVAVDASGRAYVTGNTWSPDFPVVNAAQPSPGAGGNGDVFVTALNEAGTAFVYSTYLGGNDYENPQGTSPSIAVTPSGEAAVTGATRSTDFPTTADALQRTLSGTDDAFLSRFDATGALRDSTLLGRTGADYGQAVAVDPTGVAVVAGYTSSTAWATPGTVQTVNRGADDAFILKIVPGTLPPDLVAPITTMVLSGSTGIPGWYSSPVTVVLSAVDNDQGRGVEYIEYSVNGGPFDRYTAPFTVSAPGTTQISARARDWAGNVENPPRSASVTIDATAPTIGFALSGTAGSDGWFRSSVSVSLSAADPPPGTGVVSTEYRIGSGVFQRYTSPILVSAAGITQVTARATDANGNVATSTREVKIDSTAPHTMISVAGTPGLNGWYVSPLTVTLTGFDNASGVAADGMAYRINDGPFQPYTAPFVVAAGGILQITARATDRAGNVESVLPSSQFMIDLSGPAIAIASPESRDYLHSEDMLFSFSATDNLSGPQIPTAVLGPYTVQNAQSVPLRLARLGSYTFTVTATDGAGNVSTKSVSLRIVATVDSLIGLVNFYNEQGHISDATARSLLSKLYDAKSLLQRGNTTGAAGKIRDFIEQCSATTWRGIGIDTAALLIADAEYVLSTL